MEQRVACPDVRQECVPQPLSLWGTLHQAGDVSHVQEGGDLAANKVKKIRKYFILKDVGSHGFIISMEASAVGKQTLLPMPPRSLIAI